MSKGCETLNFAQRDVFLLIYALDELLVWFGPGFDLAGFGSDEAVEFLRTLVFSLPDQRSPAAAERVDLAVDDDPSMNGSGVAGSAAGSLEVHLSRREWQLLKNSLETFLGIDGIVKDWRPETVESMVRLRDQLSKAS